MSKFYVGQRVKKVANHGVVDKAIMIGATGIIHSFGMWPKGHRCGDGTISSYDADCLIVFDGLAPFKYLGRTDCIVPLYDGNQVISWEEMKELWMPEGMNV